MFFHNRVGSIYRDRGWVMFVHEKVESTYRDTGCVVLFMMYLLVVFCSEVCLSKKRKFEYVYTDQEIPSNRELVC